MHINRTFSLKLSTVEELNDKVRPKLRSKFVNRAIQERLQPEFINWHSISTQRIMSELTHREDISEFVRRALDMELKIPQVEVKE